MAIEIKDIGAKIGSPLEALWTTVKEEAEQLIEQSKNNLIIQEEVLKLAKKKIRKNKL